jgi:integrase
MVNNANPWKTSKCKPQFKPHRTHPLENVGSSGRKKLTEQGVARLLPKAQRVDIFDAVVPGLTLRVTPRGAKSWTVVYRVAGAGGSNERGRVLKGPPRRLKLGRYPDLSLKDARQDARDALEKADGGDDPAAIRSEGILRHVEAAENTFSVLVSDYIRIRARPHIAKVREIERCFEIHVLPLWGDRKVDDVDKGDVQRLLDSLSTRLPGAAAEVRKNLSRLFEWALWRGRVAVNPVTLTKLERSATRKSATFEVEEERGRDLTDLELVAVWRAAEQIGYPFGPFFQLLTATGQRRNEIAKLRWSWVHQTEEGIYVEFPSHAYKNRRPHVLPLSALTRYVLFEHPWSGDLRIKGIPRIGDFVFATRPGTAISGFSKVKRRLDALAGVTGWTLHDLRKTASSGMARMGLDDFAIERVLGHTPDKLHQTYRRWSTFQYWDPKLDALEQWGQRIDRLLKEEAQ